MGEVGIDSYRGEGGRDQKLRSNINTIAKNLRKRLTNTENVLWRYLRAKQIEGSKFRRQEPIGKNRRTD
jgi:very-short-patch-repair endonuclease